MCFRMIAVMAFLLLTFGASLDLCAVTIDSSGETGGPDAAALVNTIVDLSNDYFVVVGSENTTINASGNPSSNLRAMGKFTNGVTSAGTLLPAANQNTAGDAQYAGGIDIDSGICLCTSLITDNDSQVSNVPTGLSVGVEGPNNGHSPSFTGVIGEIDFILGTPSDNDFVGVVSSGGDATVLQFKITLTSPRYLRISFVHATDEHPQYSLGTYNDTPLYLWVTKMDRTWRISFCSKMAVA